MVIIAKKQKTVNARLQFGLTMKDGLSSPRSLPRFPVHKRCLPKSGICCRFFPVHGRARFKTSGAPYIVSIRRNTLTESDRHSRI